MESKNGSDRIVMIDFGSAFMESEGVDWERRTFKERVDLELEYWKNQFD